MRSFRRHLTYANLVATLALFAAVATGGAWAASTLIPGSRIKPGTLGTTQLATNAVTSVKVRNGSLLAADFKSGQLPAGAAGAKGETGAKGDKGDAGAAGATGAGTVANSTRADVPTSVTTTAKDLAQLGNLPSNPSYSGNYASTYVTQGDYDTILVNAYVRFASAPGAGTACWIDRYVNAGVNADQSRSTFVAGQVEAHLVLPDFTFGAGKQVSYHVSCQIASGSTNVTAATIGMVASHKNF